MKNNFTSLLLISALLLASCATRPVPRPSGPEVAVVLLKLPKEKELRRVVIALRKDTAPQTVANFEELADRHYYDGMRFHRVFAHSLLQTGDPKSRHGESGTSGTGGPGYTIPAEIRLPHQRGAVAMSRLPDNINPLRASNGSQFYICLEPLPQLNGEYTVFGQVTEGLEVLDGISTIPVNSNNFPLQKVVITSITIEPR